MGPNGKPGASLYGWSECFPDARVFGADIDRNILFRTDKIMTFYGDQTNPEVIHQTWTEPSLEEDFDIIVEDGLHTFSANVCFFENSVHKLKPNGFFIIEDIHGTDEPLFKTKLEEWKQTYPGLSFTFLKIPSHSNHLDNNLVIVFKGDIPPPSSPPADMCQEK